MIRTANGRTHCDTAEDVAAWIAAQATKVIASGNHPGRNLETVGRFMTSDAILDLIRDAYTARLRKGMTGPQAIEKTGSQLIALYCDRAGI